MNKTRTVVFVTGCLIIFSAYKSFDINQFSLTSQQKKLRSDFTTYRRKTSLYSIHPVIARQLINNCTHLVYNRVPKCASRTILRVFTEHGKVKNYTSIYIDKQYHLNERLYKEYVEKMNSTENDRFVLTSHFYFSDFRGYYNKSLIFINVVRDPVTWFDSVFNFHKYDEKIYHPKWAKEMTVNDCVKSKGCIETVKSKFSAMRFLCGQSENCSLNTKWTRDRALRRLEEDYLVIGVYEKLRQFTEMVEFLMPHMFRDLPKYFDRHEEKSMTETKTVKKDILTRKEKQQLKEGLSYEYDVYNAIYEKFNKMYNFMKKVKH